MNARLILLAGCLFALPAFLSAQGAPAHDATAQLRAAVEKLRAADLTPAERARLMDTLKVLHEKLAQVHADGDAQEQARNLYDRPRDQAKKAQADEEVARVYERTARAHAEKGAAEDASAHERALRTYSVAKDKTAAAEKALVEHKSENDRSDYLVKQLHSLHQAESDAAQGQDQAAAERVRELVIARGAQRAAAAQQPGAVAQRMGPAAQDPEIRELIAQVRRQLAEVRRLMGDIRRRMDAPEGVRSRIPGRGAAPGQGVAPFSVNRNQALPPAPVPPDVTTPAPAPAQNPPRGRRRGADAESQPQPPDMPAQPPAQPPVQPRRRTAEAMPGMPGGGAGPVSAPEAPGLWTPVPPALPQPAEAPRAFPLPGAGGVTTPTAR